MFINNMVICKRTRNLTLISLIDRTHGKTRASNAVTDRQTDTYSSDTHKLQYIGFLPIIYWTLIRHDGWKLSI